MDVCFEMMLAAENAKNDLEKADLMLNEAITMHTKDSEYDDEMHIWIASDYIQKVMEQLEKIIMIWDENKNKKKGGK